MDIGKSIYNFVSLQPRSAPAYNLVEYVPGFSNFFNELVVIHMRGRLLPLRGIFRSSHHGRTR